MKDSKYSTAANIGSEYRRIVRHAVAHRHQAIVYDVARRLHQLMRERPIDRSSGGVGGSEWICIQSLSQLRAVVGGRFQNLKQRWIAAGFPLREHRGDRREDASLDNDGWIELAAWIAKQGFDTRLLGPDEKGLFEVSPIVEKPTD
jgi:hypothetical protein